MKDKYKIRVLVVGNNPIELNQLADQLNQLPERLVADYAFDKEGVLHKLSSASYDILMLDDNLGEQQLVEIIEIAHQKYQMPISLLKTENKYQKSLINVEDYLMKVNISTQSLLLSIERMIRFGKLKFKKKLKNKFFEINNQKPIIQA